MASSGGVDENEIEVAGTSSLNADDDSSKCFNNSSLLAVTNFGHEDPGWIIIWQEHRLFL